MATVKVYSTPVCPYCKQAKQWLTEHNVEFEDLDVVDNEEARNDLVEKSGQMGVPVLDIDGTIIVGFDAEKMKQTLKL